MTKNSFTTASLVFVFSLILSLAAWSQSVDPQKLPPVLPIPAASPSVLPTAPTVVPEVAQPETLPEMKVEEEEKDEPNEEDTDPVLPAFDPSIVITTENEEAPMPPLRPAEVLFEPLLPLNGRVAGSVARSDAFKSSHRRAVTRAKIHSDFRKLKRSEVDVRLSGAKIIYDRKRHEAKVYKTKSLTAHSLTKMHQYQKHLSSTLHSYGKEFVVREPNRDRKTALESGTLAKIRAKKQAVDRAIHDLENGKDLEDAPVALQPKPIVKPELPSSFSSSPFRTDATGVKKSRLNGTVASPFDASKTTLANPKLPEEVPLVGRAWPGQVERPLYPRTTVSLIPDAAELARGPIHYVTRHERMERARQATELAERNAKELAKARPVLNELVGEDLMKENALYRYHDNLNSLWSVGLRFVSSGGTVRWDGPFNDQWMLTHRNPDNAMTIEMLQRFINSASDLLQKYPHGPLQSARNTVLTDVEAKKQNTELQAQLRLAKSTQARLKRFKQH